MDADFRRKRDRSAACQLVAGIADRLHSVDEVVKLMSTVDTARSVWGILMPSLNSWLIATRAALRINLIRICVLVHVNCGIKLL